MGDAFPEIKAQELLATNVIKEEEHSFLKTLDQGLLLLDTIIEKTKGKEVSGKKVFELKDTYGFPEDLTGLILSEKGFTYNENEYKIALQEQQDRGRVATAMETDDWQVLIEDEEEEFVGYDSLEVSVKLTRYRKVTTKKDGELYQLVFINIMLKDYLIHIKQIQQFFKLCKRPHHHKEVVWILR